MDTALCSQEFKVFCEASLSLFRDLQQTTTCEESTG